MSMRADAKARTRAKVLAVAASQFATQGYERTTIRTIAKEMRMSTGAIFANFKGKEELYQEIHGHPPISPEVGRVAIIRLALIRRALHPTDLANLEASIGKSITDVLQLAGWKEPTP